ncbi:hypothetical protein GEV33_015575 [Tenebrio molitor]|uniref:Cytochrome P450 monooxygenase n=1 Tax=Tenebrio molitor TaxID=7067 RepID=A0A8J6LB15_TENMO|nr:hypothetical protein GEV33_015575 [Tenebrio molitor]
MGTKLQFNTEKEVSYKRAVFTIGDVLLYRLIHTWLIYKLVNFFSPKFFEEKKALKVLHNFTREVIAERERTFEKIQLPTEDHEVYTGKRRLAMLDLLITAKNEEGTIDDEGIREEVDTFMFEGHDTTAAALNFAFMLIACNKHVQEQIVEEIGMVLGDARQKPTYKDLQEMKYLERAVKEVLRLYPSVHFISRKLGDDLITGSGYKLPKGTITHLHIYDLHHNPDIYPDPERFDPDRFLPENCQNRHPFAYLPFSAGPRNCIGQRFAMLELKAAICGVLANFVLEPVDTPDTIVLVVDLVLRTKDPIRVKEGILVGNMTHLQTDTENIFNRLREWRRNFYPMYKFFAVHVIAANILTPEDCELVMSNPVHSEKGKIYDLLHNWLKDGLLTSNGSKWQTRRRILTPAFHFNILQQFILVFNEEADKLVEAFRSECKKSYINITPHVAQFTLKTITETAMGTKLHFNTQKEINYKEAVYEIGRILLYRLSHPWFIEQVINFFSPWYLQERRVTKTLHTFTKEVISDREKNFKDVELPAEEHDVYKGKKRLAMLDLLLSAKNKEGTIDNAGIQEEVDTFMFEGHDTTAMALGFSLMLLASHKHIQELVVQEMREVLGDLRKKPTYNDLQSLKYMERCIKESLRLYPSVHFISRTLGADLKTHSGYFLPKGTPVVIHIYDVHHDPEIYPDPEKFDPDRFLPENCQNRHPFAYLPFSAGPRNCIGQKFAMLELKAALCAVLGSFVLEPIDTPETVVVVVDIVLRTKEGIKVKFVPREGQAVLIQSTRMFPVTVLVYVAALTAIFFLLKLIKILLSNYAMMSKLAGPPQGGVIIGNMWYLQGTPELIFQRLREARKNFYPIYKLNAMFQCGANILSPEDCEVFVTIKKKLVSTGLF